MDRNKCVIVGASHAGTTLALQLRREGWQGPISLISAESEIPYHRPPLSKDLLSGARELDAIRLRPEKMFADNEIDLYLGESVLAIDANAQTVQLQNRGVESYDKLALCVGSSVRKLPMGQDLDNVHYLRTAADALLLRGAACAGKRAVVIGAGYIGLEVAAVLRQSNMDVTVLERDERVLSRVTSAEVSSAIQELHESKGVHFRLNTEVAALLGEGSVSHVRCSDGKEFPADMVIIGIGITPNTRLAESAGLVINNGILVDEFTQTSDQNIVAAGDCTTHPSALYQRAVRLESVQNANDQARVAAANLSGKKTVYDAVPWFWSDQYEIKLQSAGLLQGYDELLVRGDTAALSFAVFYLREGRLIAADCIARPKEFMAAKQLVKTASSIVPERLLDPDSEPASWLK